MQQNNQDKYVDPNYGTRIFLYCGARSSLPVCFATFRFFTLCWDCLRAQIPSKTPVQLPGEGTGAARVKWNHFLKLCMYRKSLVSHLGLFSFFFVFPFQFFFVWLQQCASFLADQLLCFNIDDSAVGLPRWSSISHCAQTQGLLHAISTRMFTSRF